MSSIDYEIFLDDMISEFKRLKKVYAGKEADQPLNALSIMDTTHLQYLCTTQVPGLSKALYGNAYDHMKASFRAITVANFSRRDFYMQAQEDMDRQANLYSEKRKIFIENLSQIEGLVRPDIKDKIAKSYEAATGYKKELEMSARQALGLSDDTPITEKAVIEFDKQRNNRS